MSQLNRLASQFLRCQPSVTFYESIGAYRIIPQLLRIPSTPCDSFLHIQNCSKSSVDTISSSESAQKIFKEMSEQGILHKRSYSSIDVLEYLIDVGVNQEYIYDVILTKSHLFERYSSAKWKDLFEILQDQGFRPNKLFSMVCNNEQLFNMSRSQISDSVTHLRKMFSSGSTMLRLCSDLPVLLTTPSQEIEEKLNKLSNLFIKRDFEVILNSTPSILLTPIDETNEKLDYVLDVLNIPERSIAKSNLFRQSLERVIVRCEMLLKSGLYVRPDKYGQSPVLNPSLRDIVSSSDEVFCGRVAECSVEELRAFTDMFRFYDERSPEFIGNEIAELDSDGEEVEES